MTICCFCAKPAPWAVVLPAGTAGAAGPVAAARGAGTCSPLGTTVAGAALCERLGLVGLGPGSSSSGISSISSNGSVVDLATLARLRSSKGGGGANSPSAWYGAACIRRLSYKAKAAFLALSQPAFGFFFNVFFQLVPELPGQTIPTRPLVLQAAALLRRDFITAMAAWPSARLARFPSRAARTFRYRLGDLLGLSGTLVVCAFWPAPLVHWLMIPTPATVTVPLCPSLFSAMPALIVRVAWITSSLSIARSPAWSPGASRLFLLGLLSLFYLGLGLFCVAFLLRLRRLSCVVSSWRERRNFASLRCAARHAFACAKNRYQPNEMQYRNKYTTINPIEYYYYISDISMNFWYINKYILYIYTYLYSRQQHNLMSPQYRRESTMTGDECRNCGKHPIVHLGPSNPRPLSRSMEKWPRGSTST